MINNIDDILMVLKIKKYIDEDIEITKEEFDSILLEKGFYKIELLDKFKILLNSLMLASANLLSNIARYW